MLVTTMVWQAIFDMPEVTKSLKNGGNDASWHQGLLTASLSHVSKTGQELLHVGGEREEHCTYAVAQGAASGFDVIADPHQDQGRLAKINGLMLIYACPQLTSYITYIIVITIVCCCP
jgi:hypothetical protein